MYKINIYKYKRYCHASIPAHPLVDQNLSLVHMIYVKPFILQRLITFSVCIKLWSLP